MKLGLLTLLLSFPSLFLAQDNKKIVCIPTRSPLALLKCQNLTTKLKGIMIGQSL